MGLSVYTALQFDDNVNLVPTDRQSDTIVSAGFNALLDWPVTTRSDINLNAGLGYTKYLENTRLSHFDIAPNSSVSWNLGFEDGTWSFFDAFSYSQSVITQGAVAGTAELPRFDNVVGTRVSWEPGQWVWQGGYSHDNFFSDDPGFSYLNRASEFLFARGGHRFAESTQAGVEASASYTRYDLPIQSDNVSYSLGPYVEWQATKTLSATIRGGPTFYDFFSPPPGHTLDSYYFGFDLRHQLTDWLHHELNFRRDVQLGLNQGSDYVEQFTATYTAGWPITQHLTLGAHLAYENGLQPFQRAGATIIEHFERFGAGASLSFQFTRKLSSGIEYLYWQRVSDQAGHDYIDNVLTLRLDYLF
jgi:hypothetical protein